MAVHPPKPLASAYLEEDLRFEQRAEALRRICFCVLSAIIAAAFLGVFGGPGPLNRRHVSQDGYDLTHQRFVRAGAGSLWTLTWRNTPQRRLKVIIDEDLASAVRIESMLPEPVGSVSNNGGMELAFNAAAGGFLHVWFVPRGIGLMKGSVIINGTRLMVSYFSYP